MLPILFSIGIIPVSSFGLFLALGFLAAVFVSWRLARAYDLDESKILDLGLLIFFGGLIFARVYFVLLNLNYFTSLSRIFLINLYPGLSLWGSLIGGIIVIKILTAKSKLNFWQIMDIASIGLMLGLVFGGIGCFLGGCGYGIVSSSPIAISVVGLIGKRLPVSILEAPIYLFFFIWLWKTATRFHFNGKVLSIALMLLGLEKFLAEYFRVSIWQEQVIPLILFILGLVIYYKRSKRVFTTDVASVIQTFVSAKKRDLLLQRLNKYCYNSKIDWRFRLDKIKTSIFILPRKIKKGLHVKSTPRNYQ